MPVFGADPDEEVKAWSEYEGPTRKFASKPVNTLTNYFGYHPQMKMSQVFEDKDKLILTALFSRQLKQGHTEASIKKMIDRFWQSWGAESERPAFTFVSNKVQQELIKEAEIVKNDPVLEWMLDGMPNNGPFEDAGEMRRLILRYSTEGIVRYPEVVAAIIRIDGGNEGDLLMGLDDLIVWHIDPSVDGAHLYHVWTSLGKIVSMPPELCPDIRRRRIRPRFDTVQEAIANIPLHKRLEW